MNKDETFYIHLLLAGVLVALAVIFFTNNDWFSFQIFDELIVDAPTDVSDFQLFAILVNVGYDMLPTILQQFSIGATTTQLLQTGFSPIYLAIISTFALLGGQMIMYVVGMFIRKAHKGSIGQIASESHFFHKHHFLIYLMIPFVGILGDFVMLYSGHQRISPVKIIPYLIVANFLSTLRWIIPMLFQLEASTLF